MNHLNQPPQDSLFTALRPFFRIDQRRFTVLVALILAIIQQRSVVLNNLKATITLPGSREMRYQRLLRFVQFLIPEEMYLKFALHVLGTDELTLILDRTNWKLGKRDVNILMLSAVWEGFSLPLMWRFLPHGGSSDQRIRKELMADFLRHCPQVHIDGLLADREFIGQDWFTFLSEHGIAPCIRLRSDTKMDSLPVHVFAKKMQVGEVRVWHSSMVVYGVRLRVLALKVSKTEMLYLAYKGRADQNLRKYALRWQCENLHAALKTRGFDLEATGLTQAERVSTLLMVIAISFIWCLQTGVVLLLEGNVETMKAKRQKAHGYASKSLFRLGLDELRDLLSHPSPENWNRLARLVPRFEG